MITREKTTRAGRLLEIDYYMVDRAGRRVPNHMPKPKSKAELAAQKTYEKKRRIKKSIEYVNANFDESDYFMTLTYDDAHAPLNFKRCEMDVNNYINRVKRHRAKELKKVQAQLKKLPKHSKELRELRNSLLRKRRNLRKPLKWWLSFEKVKYKTGKHKGKPNFHAHFFISGGLSPAQMEKLWGRGIKTSADSYKPEMWSPEAAARYMGKDPEGSRTVRHSRNLSHPKVHVRDGVFTRANLERLCKERVDDNGYWQRKFKGYRLLQTVPRYNPWNNQWYMTVVMWRTDGEPPPWDKQYFE